MLEVFKSTIANRISRKLRPIVGAFALMILVFVMYQSPLMFEDMISIAKDPIENEIGRWSFVDLNLKTGDYYLSLGRPHGRCDVIIDGDHVSSNYSEGSDFRSSLFMGIPIRRNVDGLVSIDIICKSLDSSKPAFNHAPIVSGFISGFILQSARVFTYLILGPLSASFILFGGILLAVSSPERRGFKKLLLSPADMRLVLFAFFGLLYSFSLAHVPRLVLPEINAAVLHILLRHSFSLSFLFLIDPISRSNRIWSMVHLASASLTLFVLQYDASRIFEFYRWQAILFPISSLFVLVGVTKIEARSKSDDIMKYVAATWVLNQVFDLVTLWFRTGVYNSPGHLAVMCGMLFLVKIEERRRQDLLLDTQQRVLSLSRLSPHPSEVIRAISSELHGASGLIRSSAYLDAYVTGGSSRPKELLNRIFEEGYDKNTTRDWQVDTREGRGQKMLAAMEKGDVLMHQGADGHWYINMGFGHACINLSVLSSDATYLAYQAFDTMRAIRPALNEFESRLVEHATKSRLAMHRVRSMRGNGSWSIEAGAIFLDIVGYSSQTTLHGTSYVRFIREVYIEALIKRLSPYAQVERVEGDEFYFSILPDFLAKDDSVGSATATALSLLENFIRGNGHDLAVSEGYESPNVRVGADLGMVELIVTDTDVATLGQIVNFASRLQSAARKGEFLVSSRLASLCESVGAICGIERQILKKEDVILARSVSFWSNFENSESNFSRKSSK